MPEDVPARTVVTAIEMAPSTARIAEPEERIVR
jgi:hypothetical protein